MHYTIWAFIPKYAEAPFTVGKRSKTAKLCPDLAVVVAERINFRLNVHGSLVKVECISVTRLKIMVE